MRSIEYVYSAHSAYAYLGSNVLSDICRRNSVRLVHKPILLSPVVEAQGGKPFHERTQAHVDYFFGREIERWAEFRGIPIIKFRPTHHDADYSLASGMIIALGETGVETDAMAHSLLEAHWRDDADLSCRKTLASLAIELGHDAETLLQQAATERVQAVLLANSDLAREKYIFGSPTYILDGDPFYGQDHLELLERALSNAVCPVDMVQPFGRRCFMTNRLAL